MPAASPSSATGAPGGVLASAKVAQPPSRLALAIRTIWRRFFRSTQDAGPGPIVPYGEDIGPELADRLNLTRDNGRLVQEIYEIAQRQVKGETERQGRLDSKANGLLAIVGFSLSVSFTFGAGFLLAQREVIQKAHPQLLTCALTLFACALASGFSAGFCALLALRVRPYSAMSEQTVFSKVQLVESNALDGEKGVAAYRRWLIIDMWRMSRTQHMAHEEKARWIKRGHRSYFAFLVAMIGIGAVLFALTLYGAAHSPSGSGTPPTAPTR